MKQNRNMQMNNMMKEMNKYFLITAAALLLPGFPAMAQEADPEPAAAIAVTRSAELSRLLLFVADRDSADAAAPKVAALLKGVDPRSIRVADYDLGMMQAMRCFGSTSLQQALHPVIPMLQPEQYPQLEPYRQYYEAMWSYMDDLAATFGQIDSKQSADRAASMVEEFPPFLLSLLEKAVPPLQSDDATARAETYMGRPITRVKAGRLLTAWGRLQQRSSTYYGSERLEKALGGLNEVMQNLNIQADPDGIGTLTRIAHDLVPLLREWIAVARTVRDRPTADAAAPKFLDLRRRMGELSQGLSLGEEYETDIFNICPEGELLVHICDHITHYFEKETHPPFYGSAALQEALTHED